MYEHLQWRIYINHCHFMFQRKKGSVHLKSMHLRKTLPVLSKCIEILAKKNNTNQKSWWLKSMGKGIGSSTRNPNQRGQKSKKGRRVTPGETERKLGVGMRFIKTLGICLFHLKRRHTYPKSLRNSTHTQSHPKRSRCSHKSRWRRRPPSKAEVRTRWRWSVSTPSPFKMILSTLRENLQYKAKPINNSSKQRKNINHYSQIMSKWYDCLLHNRIHCWRLKSR